MEDQGQVSAKEAGTGIICLRWYLCLLAGIAPLRFGSVIVSGQIAHFPANLLEWGFGNWPPFLLGSLAGLGLIWATLLCKPSLGAHPAGLVLTAWAGLPAACLLGLVLTTEWDAALTFLLYLVGVLSFLMASMKLSLVDRHYRSWLLVAIAVAAILCALNGWYQRLWGFDEMRRFAEATVLETGEQLDGTLRDKLLQTRVHRPFLLPNSYAAHLALTGPLALLLLWRAGSRVQPARLSRWIFLAAGVLLLGGAFWMSRSRGAQLALGAGFGVAILSIKGLRHWRWVLLGVGLLLGVALMFAVNQGRDLLSASARLQYYETALRIFAEQPLTGAGLGEFFPHYLRLKPPGAEETRAAHNMVLSMLSQAGILAGLAATWCLALPLWLALFQKPERRTTDPALRFATLMGVGAWSAHALLDFNLEIPPTVLTAAVLPLYCFSIDARASGRTAKRSPGWQTALVIAIGVAATAAAWRIPGERRYRALSDRAETASLRELTQLAERAAAALPHSPYPWAVHGRTALARGRPYAAGEALGKATARTPHRSGFHVQEAEAILLRGNWRAAADPAATAWLWYPTGKEAMRVNALIESLKRSGVEEPAETVRWSTAALSCKTEVEWPRQGHDPITVLLRPPPGRLPGGLSVTELCDRFSRLNLRTPLRGLPVRFAPVPDPVL